MGRSVPLVGTDRPGPAGKGRISGGRAPSLDAQQPMNSFTTSNHLNLRTVYRLESQSADQRSRARVRPAAVERGKRLAAQADYPSAAEIEQMTKQIILAILAASRGEAPPKPAD